MGGICGHVLQRLFCKTQSESFFKPTMDNESMNLFAVLPLSPFVLCTPNE